MLRTPATSLLRAGARASPRHCVPLVPRVQRAAATTTAISNPTLANIEKRWEGMPQTEQAELWMALRDRMKSEWTDLTFAEKKAAYWIAFGPHGPRAQDPPGEGKRVFFGTMLGIGAAAVIFGIMRYFGGNGPSTMTKEYQEATNEYLKSQRTDPFTGISSPDYKGKGAVQSPPKTG